jgi:acetylornithine/succinyldiaminopimelate/putrescine aminotransferase
MALAAQWPKKHIVVLRGGFGGKTLLALTGTEKRRYRIGLDPLYPHVSYVNPFSPNASDHLKQVCSEKDVAVIQLELIQGVGGVREIPGQLLEAIADVRRDHGVAIFVDEIQTGMFRTGPFVRSSLAPFTPDFLTIGKAASDMMFPFALTLYSDRMRYLFSSRCPELPETLGRSAGYETGYRCLLNALQQEENRELDQRVYESGAIFREMLREHLGRTPLVRDVRVFGLLIGIELDPSATFAGRVGINVPQLIMLRMMHDPAFPLLMGFCQYEPAVLKLTPPLSIRPEEIELCCRTIAAAVRTSPLALISTALRAGARLLRR